jgi:heavy metal sensor kinase
VKAPRIRTRLAVWFAASLLIILVPFVTGFLALQWRSMRAALDHHLEEDFEVAVEMLVVRDGLVAWRTDAERDLGYDAGHRRWVEVFGPDFRALYLRGLPEAAGIASTMPRPDGLEPGFQSVTTPAGARVRLFTGERLIGGWPLRVRVARSEDPLVDDLRGLLLIFLVSIPAGVCLAAGAGYIVSGRMLRPLSRMAALARSISAERLSERLPVGNPADEMGQLATVFNDTFARLEESFERLKRFSADVSHELRTPLTAIRSVGEVGLRERRDADGYREVIGSMLEEVDRLAHLIDELLMLSRWESGRIKPVSERFDLAHLTSQVAEQLQVLAEERGVLLAVSLAQPLDVEADRTMIRQALMNVLDNAIKYTAEHSRVRVWALSDATHHRLAVDDEGPGIPVEHRDRVAQRFYRIDDGRSRDAGGTGLGLSIADWALRAQHGRLDIDENDKGGARIWLVLPRAGAAS